MCREKPFPQHSTGDQGACPEECSLRGPQLSCWASSTAELLAGWAKVLHETSNCLWVVSVSDTEMSQLNALPFYCRAGCMNVMDLMSDGLAIFSPDVLEALLLGLRLLGLTMLEVCVYKNSRARLLKISREN